MRVVSSIFDKIRNYLNYKNSFNFRLMSLCLKDKQKDLMPLSKLFQTRLFYKVIEVIIDGR
jgi:hypothetical protein